MLELVPQREISVIPITQEDCAMSGNAKDPLEQHHQKTILTPEFLKWCQRIGMAPGAAESWGVVHAKPHVAMCWFFTTDTIALVTLATTFLVATPITMLRYSVPILVSVLMHTVNILLFWHQCTPHAHSVLWKILFVCWLGTVMPASVVGFTSKDESLVPYKSRLKYSASTAVGLICSNIAKKCGGTKDDIPKEPHKSMLRPIISGVIAGLKILDALTDMTVVAVLLTQVCPTGRALEARSKQAPRCTAASTA
jgi:hypothetical protein